MVEQLILHALGDYVIQNNKMAQRKTTSYLWAFIHAITYSLPFLLLTKGFNLAWLIIFSTHFLIDRFRLTKYWIMFYNFSRIKKEDKIVLVCEKETYKEKDIFNLVNKGDYIVTSSKKTKEDKYIIKATKYIKNTKTYFNLIRINDTTTGFSEETPIWLSTWLMIIIDNTFHITINYLCLTYLM